MFREPSAQEIVECGYEHYNKKNRWQRIEHLDNAHHKSVSAPPDISRDGTPRHADDQRDGGADDADKQRNPSAKKYASQHVTPVNVGAKPVTGIRRLELRVGYLLIGIGRDPRPHHDKQHEHGEKPCADHRRLVALEPPPRALIRREVLLRLVENRFTHSARVCRADCS